jgi:hypothetical protein
LTFIKNPAASLRHTVKKTEKEVKGSDACDGFAQGKDAFGIATCASDGAKG